MRNLLVTGGAGFIGSNFVHYMLARYPDYRIVVYDKLTYAGRLENLERVKDNPRYCFVRGDICDAAAVRAAIRQYDIDTIVNFAAFTHVDRSIMEPGLAVTNNVNGTWTLLEAARELQLERFHQVSSVTGDTPLLVRDERTGEVALRPIETLDGLDLPNYSVLTLDADNQVRFARMRRFIKHPVDEVFEIRFDGGGKIRATSEHSVFVFDGTAIVTKPSAQVRPGDMLVTFLGDVAGRERRPHRFNLQELLQEYTIERLPGQLAGRRVILGLAQEPARARELVAAASSATTPWRAIDELIAGGCLRPVDGIYQVTARSVADAARGMVAARWQQVKRRLRLPYDELVVTPMLMQVFGLYLAAGQAAPTGAERERRASTVTFTLRRDETDRLELLQRCAREVFGIRAEVQPRERIYQVTYGSRWVHRLFSQFGATAETKRLPSWIWCQPRDLIVALFKGYAGGAGVRSGGTCRHTAHNRRLIEQLVWLGRLNAINTRMRARTIRRPAGAARRTAYELVIEAERGADEPGGWRGPMARRLPAPTVRAGLRTGQLRATIRRRRRASTQPPRRAIAGRSDRLGWLRQLASSAVGLAEVRSVERISGRFMVYDVSVPGCERFFGGNVPCLLHNTDEVYGAIPAPKRSREGDPLEPRSPYSASKAGADHLVYAYAITYGMYTTITRGSNNIGPYGYPEKAVPLFTTNAIDDLPLPIYGDGKQMRDYQYVEDHCEAIDLVLHKGAPGEVYNVGTGVETHNIDMARKILDLLGKPHSLIQFVPDRAGHDRRYALDTSKIQALGWRSRHTFDQALEKTVRWYVEHQDWWRPIKSGEYLEYYRKQYIERT
jgi:dTDP-glucose 4,6-dehydratase